MCASLASSLVSSPPYKQRRSRPVSIHGTGRERRLVNTQEGNMQASLKLAWLWPVFAQQQDGHKDEENKERVGYDIDDGAE